MKSGFLSKTLLVCLLSGAGLWAGAQPCTTPGNLTATPSMVCAGGTANLNATSTGNNIDWYNVPTGGTLLGTSASGANFAVTPSATTTYYAEAVSGATGSTTFNFMSSIQNFTVPTGITSVTVEARGAQGGNTNGGKGARMIGTFAVTPGEVLGIVVGQQGIVNNCGGSNASGGGGGGSFVWKLSAPSLPIIAAGGGGGGNLNWSGSCIAGIDAVTGTGGTQGSGPTSAMGGTGGNGGFGNAPSGTGSGGGGWLTAGQNSTWGSGCTGGAAAFSFLGGNGASAFGPGGEGGYGGGGGAVCGCGGGGGYSGGGGGEGSSCRAGGGGGGSYNAGTNQANTPGFQLGNGQVIITYNAQTCTNSIRVPVTVTVDNVAPTAVCQNITVNLDINGNGSTTAAAVDNGSSDNCSVANLALSQTSFTCSDAGANTLTLTVTDNNGNTSTCNASVLVLGFAMSSTAYADTTFCGYNVSCPGGSDGLAHASVSGGCPTYSYLWSNGQTASTATGLAAGTHTVTITDGAGSTSTATVTVTAPPTFQVTATTTPSCVGDTDGSIDMQAAGGNDCQGYTYLWSNGQTTEDISGLAPGTYTVTVTDGSGCTGSQTITVPALPTPNPLFTQSGYTLTSTQTWVTYQWVFNGSNIPGATSNSYTATQSGNYALSVTDSNGCTGISDTTNVTIIGVSGQFADWSDLSIFPNPAHEAFNLRTGSPISHGITVKLTDVHGRMLMEQSLPQLGTEAAFNIKDIAAGSYFVEVVSEIGQRKLFKLVIQ